MNENLIEDKNRVYILMNENLIEDKNRVYIPMNVFMYVHVK
jgi:hypothetical protein